jgi:signal transduction histidine kinase
MGQLEARLRRLLRDSGLRLALPERETGGFVDVRGHPIGPEAAGPQQLWTELDGANRPAAAVIHDAALADDPEALEATMATAGLVIAHFRLQAELERSTDELRQTQQRTVEAPDSARRRLERELHDTAEQLLLATKLALGRARESAHGRLVRGRLAEVEQLLDSVQIELLEIAQGVQPQLLRDHGLTAALGHVAKRVPSSVALTSTRLRHHPYAVESAVYFCCVEALQNALKHGGAEVRTRIRLWELDDRLCFEVHDSGVGFEPGHGHAGAGLASMADRIGAVAGRVDVTSSPGRGTLVSGWVPA